MKKRRYTSLFQLPTSLKAVVAEMRNGAGTSINLFETTAVAEKICAMKTADFLLKGHPRLTSQRRMAC